MSFSQEIQDFIDAAKSGAAISSSISENKYRRASAKYAEERAKAVAAGDPLASLKRKKLEGDIGVLGQRSKYYAAGLTGKELENEKRRRALQNEPDLSDFDDDTEDSTDLQDESYARGGAVRVKSYADGGTVEDEEDKPKEAIPTTPGITMTPAPEGAKKTSDFSMDEVQSAVRDGLKYNMDAAGISEKSAVADPDRKQRVINYTLGKDGADAHQVTELDGVVDPKKGLSESRRNLVKLAHIYKFYQDRGESDKAKKAAGSLLGAYRGLATRFAAISAAAGEKGDIDTAVKAAMKAYAFIPDGKDITLEKTKDGKIAYSYVDDKGKTLKKGLLTPDQLLQRVTKFAMGGFDDLALAAGVKGGKDDKAPSDEYATSMQEPKAGEVKEPDYKKMKGTEVSGAQKVYSVRRKAAREKLGAGTEEEPATVHTQADLDLLDAGDYFVNPKDGKTLRKKAPAPATEE